MPVAAMFFDYLFEDPAYYWTVVIAVIGSIVLHELAHGVAAIRQGDDTPIVTGHMTWNPYVHMGGLGLGLLFIVGIAFGAMPVNPRRIQDRYGGAYVAAAGPATNLVLGLIALTIMGLLARNGIDWRIQDTQPLFILGLMNFALFVLNICPVPPLDGSVVLGDFVPGYKRFVQANPGLSMMGFAALFLLAPHLFKLSAHAANQYLAWIVRL